MAEVPEDYDSGPDESQKLQFTRTKSLRSHKVHNAESDNPELLPEIDQEPEEQKPEEQKTKEDDFEEGKPGSAENVLLEPDRMPEEETEPETTQVLKLETSSGAGGEDLEVPTDEKSEESDLQPPDVSVDVLTEPPTETDTQLPTETNVPEAASSELPEETGQNVPEESLREGDKEIGPEQTTPDFPSEKPIKSVEEEDLPLPKMTKSEITEEIQEESAEEKSTEPSEVTQPEFPDQTLRQSTEEVDIQPPEEIPIKSTEQIDTEQSEQVKPQFPDKKPRQSIEEKVPEPPEELKQELSGEDARKPIDEASLELSEKATSEIPKETQRRSVEEKIPETLEEAALGLPEEIKPDVQGDTQEKSIEEKVPEPSEDRKSSSQTKVLRKSSGRSQSKTTLVESSKEKSPVLQEQTEAEIPKEKLIKSTEETGQVPPQMSKPEVQEKSQPEPTKEKNLELPDEPKPRVIDTEFPKEHRPEPSKLKSPIDRDELVYSGYHKKMSEKETNKAKDEYMVGSPRESMESAGTDGESQDLLKELQADDTSELVPTIPSSESPSELRDSFSDVVFSQRSEKMGPKESKINKSICPQFEHLNWSPERVAEWISELGFPQYKECFITNFISGRKLIHVNCCNLPQMGITDFEDMKTISRHTRELLGIQEPLFSRSIVLPYRDNIGLFLERKGHSGVKSDSLTFSGFIEASGLQEYSPEIEALENLSDSCQEENEASLQDNGSSEEGGAAGQGAEEKTISFSLEDQT